MTMGNYYCFCEYSYFLSSDLTPNIFCVYRDPLPLFLSTISLGATFLFTYTTRPLYGWLRTPRAYPLSFIYSKN